MFAALSAWDWPWLAAWITLKRIAPSTFCWARTFAFWTAVAGSALSTRALIVTQPRSAAAFSRPCLSATADDSVSENESYPIVHCLPPHSALSGLPMYWLRSAAPDADAPAEPEADAAAATDAAALGASLAAAEGAATDAATDAAAEAAGEEDPDEQPANAR